MNDKDAYDIEDNVDHFDINNSRDSFHRGTAPSDKFRTVNKNVKRKNAISLEEFRKHVEQFRRDVEKALQADSTDEMFGLNSMKYADLSQMIRQTKKRIAKASNTEERNTIVQNMIQGIDRFSDINYDQMALFHETVINPMTLLFHIYRVLNDYNKFIQAINVGEKSAYLGGSIEDYLEKLNENIKVDKYKFSADRDVQNEASDVGIVDDNINSVSGFKNDNVTFVKILSHLNTVGYCNKDLVSVHYSGDGAARYPSVNFNKLEKVCYELLSDVKHSIKKFRNVISPNIIQRYEENSYEVEDADSPVDNVVSLFFLEEHLCDRLFKNKYGGGLAESNTALKNAILHITEVTGGDNGAGVNIDSLIAWNVSFVLTSIFLSFSLYLSKNVSIAVSIT